MAMPLQNNPCPEGYGIHNYGRPFLCHHYYISSLSDPCFGVEKILKEKIAFHYMTYTCTCTCTCTCMTTPWNM